MTTVKGFEMDEIWVIGSSSATKQAAKQEMNRLIRKSRTLSFPPGLEDGEAVRAWLIQFAPQERASDRTEEERDQTAQWEAGVANASASGLWDRYLSYYPERR